MKRKDRYRAVFAELRGSLDSSVPALEVARLARHIIRAYETPEVLGYQDRSGRPRDFLLLPVDRLISDEPWQVWQFDKIRSSFGGPDEKLNLDISKKMKALGNGKIGWKR